MLSSSCTQFKCARQFPWYTGTGKSKNFYHHWDEVSLNYAVLGVALFTLLRNRQRRSTAQRRNSQPLWNEVLPEEEVRQATGKVGLPPNIVNFESIPYDMELAELY